MSLRKRRVILAISILAFILGASFVSLYSQGYNFDKSFNFSKRGGLYVNAGYSDSKIFVNHKKERTTGLLKAGLFMGNLKPEEYSILVAKEGYWPWAKDLEVLEGYVTEAQAFMVPQDPRWEFLLKGKFTNIWASPYKNILALQEKNGEKYLLNFYLPEDNNFLTASSQNTEKFLSNEGSISNLIWGENYLIFNDGNIFIKAEFDLSTKTVVAYHFAQTPDALSDYERFTKNKDQMIWWNPISNQVFATWLGEEESIPYYLCHEKPCELPVEIFQSRLPIKNIDFFPGRKDLIIVAVSNGIYALEIDGRDGRLLQPIYKGKSPDFAALKGEPEFIYLLDEGSLAKIYLQIK
jgi:hypothetical protein